LIYSLFILMQFIVSFSVRVLFLKYLKSWIAIFDVTTKQALLIFWQIALFAMFIVNNKSWRK
jgi:hypothetical protein